MKDRMVLVLMMVGLAVALAGVPAASARILECEDPVQAGQICPPQVAGESR
jgi:hypothetical protein